MALTRKKRIIKMRREVTEQSTIVSTIPVATTEKNCTTCGSFGTSFGKKGTCFFHPKQRSGAAKLRCKNWEV